MNLKKKIQRTTDSTFLRKIVASLETLSSNFSYLIGQNCVTWPPSLQRKLGNRGCSFAYFSSQEVGHRMGVRVGMGMWGWYWLGNRPAKKVIMEDSEQWIDMI